MRHIDLKAVIAVTPPEILQALSSADTSIQSLSDGKKISYAKNGNRTWSQIKPHLENASNRKCWYTESKNPGCLNDVEHFRPKGKVEDDKGTTIHWYWFLAFNPLNYRLSCILPNRPNINSVHDGKTGGKGDQFPLLGTPNHATNICDLVYEQPVILDPCNHDDTILLAFAPDGRPVLSPLFTGDAVAFHRVEASKLLLNLDYPTFNVDRERLYNRIVKLVARGDRYKLEKSSALDDIKDDLLELVSAGAEYSKAAECYIRCFRDREWIEGLFT
ncbi:HNHc domain-containing protein [Pseudomonas zeae]